MSDTVQIVTDNSTVTVHSPYDPAFPPAARKLGGVWKDGAWKFAHRDFDRVRELCRTIYGTDGAEPEGVGVTVRVPLDGWDSHHADEFRLAGRRLLWRPSRDERVRYASRVVVVSGDFYGSGGSMRYPEVNAKPGTVIEVRDVPADVAQKMVDEYPTASIVDGGEAFVAALLAERDRLTARIAEIDAALAGDTAAVIAAVEHAGI